MKMSNKVEKQDNEDHNEFLDFITKADLIKLVLITRITG